MCHSARPHPLSQRLTRPSHNLKLDFRVAAMNEKYYRYFYILEGDTTRSVARFTDLGFRHSIAFSHQGAANFLQSGNCCGVSEQTALHTGGRLGIGHSKRDARLRLALADVKTLPQHGRPNVGILSPKLGSVDDSNWRNQRWRSSRGFEQSRGVARWFRFSLAVNWPFRLPVPQ